MKIAWVLPGGVDRSGDRRVIPCLLWLIDSSSELEKNTLERITGPPT